LPYSIFYEVADGQITALRAYFSVNDLVRQVQEAAGATA
jgi:limonene-1,2-epoxide hydrolase